MKKRQVLVLGGGAAGLFAAIAAAEAGAAVLLAERNPFCGKKLNITGKGRCNMTNACDLDTFLSNVPVNPRFLYRALTDFSPEDTVAFFEAHGVPTKTERGRRVFPVSDRARDVTDCLTRAAKERGVRILRFEGEELAFTERDGARIVCGLKGLRGGKTAAETIPCDRLILATGGASYPSTGSTGDGYRLAASAGHTILPPKPSLVPLVSSDPFCKACMGLSLRNVGASFLRNGKTLYAEQGELLFTHFGVSGPIVLSASAHLREGYPVTLRLDMKPALDEKTLDQRLLREFSAHSGRDLRNCMNALLPAKMIDPFLQKLGISGGEKLHSLSRGTRKRLCEGLKCIELELTGTRPIEEAIITSGGVAVTEVDPRSMASRKVRGLYFAGELLDVDAYTGGYNLQIAFATGRLAGLSAATDEE